MYVSVRLFSSLLPLRSLLVTMNHSHVIKLDMRRRRSRGRKLFRNFFVWSTALSLTCWPHAHPRLDLLLSFKCGSPRPCRLVALALQTFSVAWAAFKAANRWYFEKGGGERRGPRESGVGKPARTVIHGKRRRETKRCVSDQIGAKYTTYGANFVKQKIRQSGHSVCTVLLAGKESIETMSQCYLKIQSQNPKCCIELIRDRF